MKTENIAIEGLAAPVRIVVDRWGIPHIRADSLGDMFLAQGFNAGRDRLWQIDLWRKRGLGLLAADFGPGYLAQDRASRLFLYRGDMQAEWACYGHDGKAICEAFVRGINAYIDLLGTHPDWLPPEFAALGTRPAKWSAEDVVRVRIHSWMRNALSEVARANVMARAGADVDLLRQNLDPPKTPVVAEGLDLSAVPMEALDLFRLALAPVTFSRERLAARLEDADLWTKVTPLGEVVRNIPSEGSNNWVVHGSRTTSGRPIMASDPHRAHAVPALRYLVHLSSPEFDGIGAGEPILPGIMMGHNGKIAFGLTLFFAADEEDVYVYGTDPADPDRYRYGNGWEGMHVIEERVPVKGASDQTLPLKFTRHGPVVWQDRENRRAVAIRSLWSEPGAAPYAASLKSMRARNHAEFREAMRRWSVPAVNMVFADAEGDIAWMAVGQIPVRRTWDGLLPVPGDGRFEWDGFLTSEELPHVLNPDAGFIATANEMNLPPGWPHAQKPVGYEWYDRSRATRIAEAFAAAGSHDVEASRRLQTDVGSVPACRLMRLIAGLDSDAAVERAALQLLRGWDCAVGEDSAAAALFEVWWSKHLRPALFACATPDPFVQSLLAPGDPDSVLRELESPGKWFGGRPEQSRDRLLLESLAAAFRECAARMGDDPLAWRWGRLHHGYFEHPMSPLGNAAAAAQLDVGPLPMGGADSVPMNAMYRFDDFRVVLGASVRVVVHLGAWDESVCINAPGQSGDPRSLHYADLAPLWARGDYVPMLYSRDAVDAAAERTIVLTPVSLSSRQGEVS
jgi:penicillin amidase